MSRVGTRIGIGLTLVGMIVLVVMGDSAIGHPLLLATVLAAAVIAASRELMTIICGRPSPAFPIVAVTIIACFLARVLTRSEAWSLDASFGEEAGVVFGVLALLIQGVARLQIGRALRTDIGIDVVAGGFALVYLSLPLGFLHELALARPGGSGTLLCAAVVLISKCGDIGGYLAGTYFGRHRVLSRVSPKKSWEGSLAGLALTIGCALLAKRLDPDLVPVGGWVATVGFALAVNVATQAGDFAESMLKRIYDVKDSAALLPTFGGALDIMDSLVFAVPVAWLFLT